MEPYRFQPSEKPVQYCVLHRPHGTVITVTMDWSEPCYWKGHHVRRHHVELRGGMCTGDTGYHSYFSYALQQLELEPDLEKHMLQFANEQFQKLHPKGQFDLFEQPTL